MTRGIVTADLLNVRSFPGSQGKVIQQLEKNAVVDITDQVRSWYQIKYKNLSAYASANHISKTQKSTNLIARVTASRLNVRTEPSSSGELLGQVLQDDTLNVLEEVDDWFHIKFNNADGYVHSNYAQLIEGGLLQKGYVTASMLNVRKKPAAGSEILGKLNAGAELEIVAELKGWTEIKFNNASAYVSSKYISKNSSEQEPRYFYQKSRLKMIDMAPASQLSGGAGKEEKRIIKTWNGYGKILSEIAESLDIDVGCAIAVLCVESGGNAFYKDDHAIIRFENHQFWRRWGKYNPEIFEQHFVFSDDQRWKGHKYRVSVNDEWERFHGKQEKEWKVLELARSFDDTAALNSISIGLPQVMGFNSKKIGYSTVQKMFSNMNKDVRYQLFALFDFLDNNMISALKDHNFERFAKYYNGPGQASLYGEWIQDHYDAYLSLMNA